MKKNIWFRSIGVLLVLCIIACTVFVGCDDSSYGSSSSSGGETVSSSSEAISIAKNSSRVMDEIADCWRMQYYYTPEWGSCTAKQIAGGDWQVILKGNIDGYTDEYKTDFIYNKAFKATVTVDESGIIISVRVTKG